MRQEYFLLDLIFPRFTLHKFDDMCPKHPILFVFFLKIEVKVTIYGFRMHWYFSLHEKS